MLRNDCGLQYSVDIQLLITSVLKTPCEKAGYTPPWSGNTTHMREYGRQGRNRIIMMAIYVTTTRPIVGIMNFSTQRPLTTR